MIRRKTTTEQQDRGGAKSPGIDDEELDAVSVRSRNSKWRVKNMIVRPSMFSSDIEKIGVLKKMNSVKLGKHLSFERAHSYYFELSGLYLRYYKMQRKIKERLARRFTFFGKAGRDVQSRIRRRERPVAVIDLRLVTFELDPDAEENHIFRINSALSDEFLDLKAPTFLEARSWVRALENIQKKSREEDDRRSEALLLGMFPSPVYKQPMEEVNTTAPGIEKVFNYTRDEARGIMKDVLDQDPDRNGFSVVSFNILADMFVSKTRNPEIYKHCDKGCLGWEYRVKRIVKHLRRCEADIICLQECERSAFEGEIGQALRGRGYLGQLDCNTKQVGDETIDLPGLATFYRKNFFQLVWRERSYRSLVIGLRVLRGREKDSIVASVNSHLEGAPWKGKDRASQMKSALKKVRKKTAEGLVKYTVICGDFNDGALSDLCQNVLAGESFVSAYDNHEARDVTCLLLPLDSKSVDIEKHRVDHIFFDSRLMLRAVMDVMDDKWSRTLMIEQGLPSYLWPSDHLSIGALFAFNPNSELFNKPMTIIEEDLEPDPFTTMTSEEIFCDQNLNPLEEAEIKRFRELDNLSAVTSKGAKPSPDSLRRIKEKAIEKQTFINSLSEEKAEFLRKYIALARKEKKAEKKKTLEVSEVGEEASSSEIPSQPESLVNAAGPPACEAPPQLPASKQGSSSTIKRLSGLSIASPASPPTSVSTSGAPNRGSKPRTDSDTRSDEEGKQRSLLDTLRRSLLREKESSRLSNPRHLKVAMPNAIPERDSDSVQDSQSTE